MHRRVDRVFAGYVFDLDGTIYLGDRLLPGAKETYPLHTREDYAAKLTRLGIPTAVLVRHLQRTAPTARLLVIGEGSVKGELRAAGLTLTDDPHQTDIVVACFVSHLRLRHPVEEVVGKPSRIMAGVILARLGVSASEWLMVGDR